MTYRRQHWKAFSALEKRQKFQIASLRMELKKLQRHTNKLEQKIAEMEAAKAKDAQKQGFEDQFNSFMTVLGQTGLRMRACDITNMFIDRAPTLDDARMIVKKGKTIQRRLKELEVRETEAKLDFYRQNRYNLLRVFPHAQDFKQNLDLVAIIFNENILKVNSNSMKFYHCHQNHTYADFEIKLGFFDGKFTDCPAGFKQMVELRLLMVKNDQQVIVSYARALLSGFKTENYCEFFQAVKNSRCRKIPMIVTDFEWAVSKAVREIFPSITVRGCWYHYWNNLLAISGKLKRLTCQVPNKAVFNFLTIISMVHHPEFVLLKLVEQIRQPTLEQTFRDVNFKLIFYVYKTYFKLFGFMFFLDLSRALDRTNNSSEGSNAQLSRFSGMRLKKSEFAIYTRVAFKKELMKQPTRTKPISDTSSALLAIQEASKSNTTDLFSFLYSQMGQSDFQIKALSGRVPTFEPESTVMAEAESTKCWQELESLYVQYKAFRKAKREEWKARKKNKADAGTAITNSIAEYHEKKIMNKLSRNAKKQKPNKFHDLKNKDPETIGDAILDMSQNNEGSDVEATGDDE